MSVKATCPQCGLSSTAPDEAVGRKVRCKKCQTTFTIEGDSSGEASSLDFSPAGGAAPKVARGSRPSSQANLSSSGGKPRPRSSASIEPSSSGISRRPAKKSNATMWVVLSVVGVVLIGGAGVGAWLATQEPAPVKQAKTKVKREDPVDRPMEKVTSRPKDASAKESPQTLAANKERPLGKELGGNANPKTPPSEPKEKDLKPVAIAPLAMSTPIDGLKELTSIKSLIPIGNHPHKIGMHVVAGKDHYFELYDLKKKEQVTRFKLDDKTVLLDVDPNGDILATSTSEKRFNVYGLPEGALLEDEWSPYDNIKDELRFLTGGKIEQVAMIDRTKFWVMTSLGFGDLWEIPGQKVSYTFPAPERTDFRKPGIAVNRDFVLSPDRTMFAYATDEGIQIHDARDGKRSGTTPKLTKYGGKPELVSMGFEPGGTKLAVYFSANKEKGRPFFHARFSVPGGEELMVEAGPDPGDENLEFVNSDYFLAIDRRTAELRDGQGKVVAECRFSRGAGLFAPRVVQSNLAFAYVNEKNTPILGLAKMPLGGPVAAPPPVPVETKGKSLTELFAPPPTPEEKAPAGKARTFEQLEVWEFGGQGIIRTGIKTFDK